VQEQLEQALERIKLVEQERDAFKTAAKNEEVARIAAEGRIPLPVAETADDEFASPKKTKRKRPSNERVSLTTMEIASSAATEIELEELSLQVDWERQRADRAEEMIDFLKAECEMHCCACSKNKPKAEKNLAASQHEASVVTQVEPNEVPARERSTTPVEPPASASLLREEPNPWGFSRPKSKKEPRLSTIFCPREGIFRTVSEQEADLVEAQRKAEASAMPEMPMDLVSEPMEDHAKDQQKVPEIVDDDEVDDDEDELPAPDEPCEQNIRMYARTPSVEPPSFALLAKERVSLLSLLNAPHGNAHTAPVPRIPVVPAAAVEEAPVHPQQEVLLPAACIEPRPHTSATNYSVTTTTTTVPVRDENERSSSSFSEKLRTPSSGSFDLTNPALTPTMTREQALAKIRERRGRARSMQQGAATPHKKMLDKNDRRHMSAPTGKNRL
jgi:hypothetical protein